LLLIVSPSLNAGAAVPIRAFIGNASFTPEKIEAMTFAFNDALAQLGLVDRTDPLAEIVAKKIIEICRVGECDPKRLCELALKDIRR
jgi:hypothetical protein